MLIMTNGELYKFSTRVDTSNITFINDIWIIVSTDQVIIKTSAVFPVVLWGIFGNILLLYAIVTRPNMRTPTCLLIGNMALADLIFSTFFPAVFLVYDFFQNYQLGNFGCKVEGAFECTVLLASVMSLLTISYDRLTVIVLPEETRLTPKTTNILLALSWIFGLILASPLFVFREYRERQWKNFLEKYCTEDTVALNIYWHVIITMLVWLPLLIMLICYISIYVKLHRYQMKSQSLHAIKYKKTAAKMICFVVVTFMICRTPFTALIFYRNYLLKQRTLSGSSSVQNQASGTFYVMWFTSKYLICLNAAINPIIYGLMNDKFKKALKETFLFKCIRSLTTNKKHECGDTTKKNVDNNNKSTLKQ
ncbi:substance-K receptor [Agrilus planipennis]|uniref:Substance-K receptor n=1 Tax=Agrilus planipennis TaxID=224129 RepID=A0A1W4X2D2_AGRPL|nr:substance-K receptor [Agrilus planipennis]